MRPRIGCELLLAVPSLDARLYDGAGVRKACACACACACDCAWACACIGTPRRSWFVLVLRGGLIAWHG